VLGTRYTYCDGSSLWIFRMRNGDGVGIAIARWSFNR
jgi:hypothetical protein